MRLGIMQPYFFPYVGYFDLMNCVDEWVVFDTAQYMRRHWVNRNRILHPSAGWQYITAPVRKHHRDTAIRDILVQEGAAWKGVVLRQLDHYKKTARRRFDGTRQFVEACLDTDEPSLSALNTRILEMVCERLGIACRFSIFSEMDLPLGPVEGPGDWALRIAEAMGAEEYVNAPGGEGLFDEAAFARAGIRLIIRHLPPFEYACPGYEFVPNLSIVDALMWNSPEEIKDYLDRHNP
ncbi:MAG: WbqC family protein [Candidatus Hydrogenedentes bacterium]|nr:WbqC family protein [Candidatus Hydrogenedentota bacterium]